MSVPAPLVTSLRSCPGWCDVPRPTSLRPHVHTRLLGIVPVPRGHARTTNADVLLRLYPGTTRPVVALRTDGVPDFGVLAVRRLVTLLIEAERIMRSTP
ncbi:hypothetical protein GCM10010124_39780 [Pilimelia terevasa]|uniref:Uncharacterized protein n=1 Tax=Pilimelia terevasa TaxID=53372 RepID=A0A8J3FJU8_9ACTN|nr:hypothetical protein GCM10010124_39780 [Pilimelia terevasa]